MAATTNDLAIAGLYISLLQRAPDASGFSFWGQALNNGSSREAVAQTMSGAPEVLGAQTSTQTSAQFVTLFYTNILGRAPDAGGLAFWSSVLENLGGAANVGARAALVLQITDVLATPLTTQAAGVSIQDYQRSVADRALFANKVEFGVFFATQLKSNDVALAKAALALVTSDPASIQAASRLAQGIVTPQPEAPAIPTPSVTAADTPADIANKFAFYLGTEGTVDASGMVATQLDAVATVISKVAVVRNLNLALRDVSDATTSSLLSKAPVGSVRADAGSASTVELQALAANVAKLADNGITGTLTLSRALTADELGKLTSAKTDAAANVVVDASSMSNDQLIAVNTGIAKVDSINNLSVVLADLGNDATVALLNKATAGSASVRVSGANHTTLNLLLPYLGKIATDGITGDLTLDGRLSASQLTSFLTKAAPDATVTVDASGMAFYPELISAFAALVAKVDHINGGLSFKLSNFSVDTARDLLAKSDTGSVRLDTIGALDGHWTAVVANIDKVNADGLSGRMTLPSSFSAADLTTLLGKITVSAVVTVDTSSMTMAQLEVIGSNISKIDTMSTLPSLALGSLSDTATANLLNKVAGNVTVDATSATLTELSSLAGNIGKIDTINSLTFSLQDVDDGTTSALLSKAQANGSHITVTGASATEVTTVLGNLGKIADGGLSGTLKVSYASLDAGINATLSSKIAPSSGLDVTGTSAREVMSFPGLATGALNLRIDPAGGGDLITLGAGTRATVLISDRSTVRNSGISANDTNTDKLLRIESSGVVTLQFSTAEGAFGQDLAFAQNAFASSISTKISGQTFTTLGDVIAQANLSFPNAAVSTNQQPAIYTLHLEGGSGLQGSFKFLDDGQDNVLTLDDLIMTTAVSALAINFSAF